MTQSQIQKPSLGSPQQIADEEGRDLREVITEIEYVLLLDTSSSMSKDSTGGKSRWEHAKEALSNLQKDHQGQFLLITFATGPQIRFDGRLTKPSGATHLTKALEMASRLDGTGVEFIVVSDGRPNNERKALDVGKTFIDTIHTIYIGKEGGKGEEFMNKLATGERFGQTDPVKLEGTVTKLLTN